MKECGLGEQEKIPGRKGHMCKDPMYFPGNVTTLNHWITRDAVLFSYLAFIFPLIQVGVNEEYNVQSPIPAGDRNQQALAVLRRKVKLEMIFGMIFKIMKIKD